MKIKISDYIWKYIAGLGIKHIFMFPGGGAMHLVDSLGRCKDLEYVTMLHEQSCAMAAEVYARIDYSFGAALVTTGPGGTNAITGVAAAWLESTPVLVISGQVKTMDLKKGSGVRQLGSQELDIVEIVSSITKYAVTVTKPEEIRYHLDRAVYEMKSGRQGPVWLDIPLDIQAAVVETDKLKGYLGKTRDRTNQTLKNSVAKVIKHLKAAKRPVIIAGQGIERNNGKEVFRKLAGQLNIPILTSWIAVELLEHSHPCNMGKPGMVAPRYSNNTIQKSDLIIAVGTRLDPSMIGYDPKDFAPGAKKIIVDIDEYELNKFKFPIDMKILSDAADFIKELSDQIENTGLRADIKDWLEKCQYWKRKYPVVPSMFNDRDEYINPYHFMDILSDALASDDIVIPGSSGAGMDVFWLCIRNQRKQRMLATGSLGSMGYGIPAGIGACLASGKRTVIIEGDGSLQLNIQELAMIAGRKLPIKIFIFNNGGYLSIMNTQRTHFDGRFVGAEKLSGLYIPDIEKIASAYGLQVYKLRSPAEVKETVQSVLAAEGPALCNIPMRSDLSIQPRVMSEIDKDGSMVSGGLLDLWPPLQEEV